MAAAVATAVVVLVETSNQHGDGTGRAGAFWGAPWQGAGPASLCREAQHGAVIITTGAASDAAGCCWSWCCCGAACSVTTLLWGVCRLCASCGAGDAVPRLTLCCVLCFALLHGALHSMSCWSHRGRASSRDSAAGAQQVQQQGQHSRCSSRGSTAGAAAGAAQQVQQQGQHIRCSSRGSTSGAAAAGAAAGAAHQGQQQGQRSRDSTAGAAAGAAQQGQRSRPCSSRGSSRGSAAGAAQQGQLGCRLLRLEERVRQG
jgi:hypothetical protein